MQLDPKFLTSEQLRMHRAIIRVRNEALAHVYKGRDIDGSTWHKGSCFGVCADGIGWSIAFSSHQVGFSRDTFTNLKTMLPIARNFLEEKYRERMSRMGARLRQLGVDDRLFREYLVDPIEIFGSEQNALAALAAVPPVPKPS